MLAGSDGVVVISGKVVRMGRLKKTVAGGLFVEQ